MRRVAALFAVAVLLACGGNPREQSLRRGLHLLKMHTNLKNPMTAAVVKDHNADSDPAGLASVYYASAPENKDYPPVFTDRREVKPWSLFLRPGNSAGTMIVEGIGEDVKNPLFVEELVFRR